MKFVSFPSSWTIYNEDALLMMYWGILYCREQKNGKIHRCSLKYKILGEQFISICYYMMRKPFKNSSWEVHFLVRVQLTGLQCWYKWTCSLVIFNDLYSFRKLFIVTLIFSNIYLQNILGWLLPCAISNQTKETFATWQHMVFIYIKQSIDSNSLKICRP